MRDVAATAPRGDVVASSTVPARRRRRGRRLLVVGALLLVAAAVVVVIVVTGDDDTRVRRVPQSVTRTAPAAALPAPATSALDVPAPADVPTAQRPTATWAPVRRSTVARTRPSASAPAVAQVTTRTPEGTDNILQVLDRREVAGALWIRVRLAVVPNGTTGWVPRTAVGGLQFAHARLVVRLGARTATLVRDGRTALRVRVGIGLPTAPTPTGSFYVRDRVDGLSDPAVGPVAFGTSARVGAAYVAIHGTERPQDIPGSVSGGSIAMRNADIRRLARLLPVGTPVIIRP